jgi:hypothetical protein
VVARLGFSKQEDRKKQKVVDDMAYNNITTQHKLGLL